MRIKCLKRICGIALCGAPIFMLFGTNANAAANEILLTAPNIGVPATALGFMLIAAANRDRR